MSGKIRFYLFSLFVIFCTVIFFYFTGCCSKSGGGGVVVNNVGGGVQAEPKLFDVKVNDDGSITKTLAPSGRLTIEAPKNTLNKNVVIHMVENQAMGNESDIYSVGSFIYAIKPDREEKIEEGINIGTNAKREVKMQTSPIILTFSNDERLTGAENYYIGIKEIGSKEWKFVNVYSSTNVQLNSIGPKVSFEYKLYKDNVLVALFADFNKNLGDRPKVLSMVASMPDNVIEIADERFNENAVIKLKFIGDNLSSLRADDYRIRLLYANADHQQVDIKIDGKSANSSGESNNKYEAFGELYAHYYEFIPTMASYSAGVTPELSFTLNFKEFPVKEFACDFVVEAFNATDKPVPFYLSDSLHFDTEEKKKPEPEIASISIALSLASDSTHIFDTAKNLYFLNPTFTVTASPSYEFTDEAKIAIASSVTLVEMNPVVRANTASSTETTEPTFESDDELLITEWNENDLKIGFRHKLATYTQYVISMNDISGLEGINVEPISPFTFRTAGTVEVTIASDSSNVIDVENNLYHCRPMFTINVGFNPNDSEKASIASAVTVIGAEKSIVTKTWNGSSLSISFNKNLAADTEYTVSMKEPAGMKRLSLKPFQPLKFKTTGDFYIALVPDVDNVFDRENSLYRCRPSFTITPSTTLSDEDQAKIASAVIIVGIDETNIVKTWASGSLSISFTQDIGQNTEFTLSISDLPEIAGRNFITFQPFVFKTIGALEFALTPDADNVYATKSPLYHCKPGFTITPSIPLNEEDRAKIASAVSVLNAEANKITKNWDNEGKLIIGFSQNIAPSTDYTLSMSAVNDIKGVTVIPFANLNFTTVENLGVTLTPNANNVYAAMEPKYRCNPGFIITPSFALTEEDRAKIANSVTINNGASVVKNWEGNNLKVSLNQNLATDTAYMLSMSAVNDIKGITVIPFEALNFTTVGALSFTVTPDDDNVYAAVSPKYQCRPGFTITPAFTLNDEDKAKIADAIVLSDAGNIATKTWDANSLKVSLTQNLVANTAYTLSMADVNDINGVTVTPFASVDFTTIGALTFTVTPDDDNLFDIPNSLTHCKPGFTVTPAFALNDADKAKILDAVTVADVASSSLIRQWNDEGKLLVSFNTKLASGTDYSLNMAAVNDIKGVTVTAFDAFAFRTMNAIDINLDSEDSNIIDVPNNLYHCRPQFTITVGYEADDDAKAIIASAVTVIGADENNITRNWVNDSLIIGFTSNLTTNTEYTVSIGDLNASFEKLAFRLPEPLTFTTTGDSYVAIVPDEGNVIVSIPNELYHCRPTFTITPSVALGDSDRATIAGAIHVSNVSDENLTKNWNASGSLILGFSQNLTHDTQYTVSINPIGEIAGVNLVLFQPLTFRTVPGLNLVLTADTGNVYEALSTIYRCNPAFTITPNFALSDANKAIIADAVSVSNSAVTLKNWDGNNLRVTFSSNLAPNSTHTISMVDVNSITGVTVTSFIPQTFTTVPVLSFTLDSPNSNVFVSTPAERYHCRPVFTLTPSFNLNEEDKTIIKNAVTISSDAGLMTKNWNGNVLEIGFSSDLANNTNYTISMNAVNSISGVSVTPVTPKSFTTIEELVISIASDSGDLFTIENGVGLYQTLPTFTVTSNMALSVTDQTTIANAISVSNIDDPYKVTKSWANATTLNISFTENLSLNSNYSITMAAVNNISGVTVTGFSPMNFRTMNALTFDVVADSSNVYEALNPTRYRCNPAFTITPNYTLSETVKTTIANAISVTNSSVTSKNWNGNELRITFSSALTPDSSYTLNMAAVNSITGVTVTPFDSLDFTTVPILTLTLDSPDSNVFISTPSELYHCRPVFTVTPSFNLNDDDKSLIADAVTISSGSSLLTKTWNGNTLEIGFSSDLSKNTSYTLSMNNVNISGVSVVKFSSKTFKTLNSLSVSIASDNGNVFTTQNGVQLYKTMPTFTVSSNSNLNSTLKNRVAEAISVSDVDSSIISKVWTNDRTLKISFTDNIAVNASYTISMAAINDIAGVSIAGFNDFSFSTMKALTFTLTPSSTNAIVTSPTELYRNRPSFTISSNYTLTSAIKTKIEEAVTVSDADGVTKSWNNSNLSISFSSDLASNSTHIISMNAVNDITGVIVAPFESFNFTIVDCLTFTVLPEEGSVYETMSPKCIRKPVFIITPNYILSQYNKNTISNAVRVSNATGVTKTWDGNNLRVTFSSNLTSNSTHTLSMNAVSIYGLPVVPFNNFDFTILEALTFTITPDPEGVYEAMSPKCRCNPAFTITPSFPIIDEDKVNIANAISVTNANADIVSKNWYGNDLRIAFSENLTPGRYFYIKMAGMNGVSNIGINSFSDYYFTTLATLTFTLTPDSGNVFSGTKYHCRPDFTITPSFTLNNEDKAGIANAVSVSGVDSSIVDKHWEDNKLILGFTQNLATDTTYTISMAEINHINGVVATSLSSSDFTTIPELILSIATNTNSIVKKSGSNADDLDVNGEKYFYCKPELVISPSFTISSETSRLIIANAVAASGNASALLTTNWNYGKLVVGFSDNLDASSTYSISMSDLNNLKGVTVKVFPQFDFNTFFYQGKGTSADPFTIYTPKQFASLDYYIPQYYYYKQMEDIDLSAYANWKPLASSTDKLEFHGYYNGNNKKISNAVIDYPDDDYVGLFAKTYGAIFNDLILENINVTGKTYVGGLTGYRKQGTEWKNIRFYDITASGTSYVGGLAGYLYASQFSDIEFSNVHVYGGGNIGGFSGYNDGGIFKNISFSNVTASGTNDIGGFSGSLSYGTYSDISCNNVEVTGNNFVGGVFGYFPITIKNCTITNSRITSSGRCSGGFAGSCCYRNDAKLRNVNCDNITLIGSGEMGGCVGSIECSLEGCSVTNSHIECLTSTNYTKVCGGLIGSTAQGYQGEYTIIDCFVSNTEIISNFSGVGGIAGSLRSQKTMDNCFVKDSTISGLSGVGGFLAGDGGGLIQNCYVENTKVSATGNTNNVGGFLGSSSSSKVESCHVASMSIETACGIVGGFIGKCESEIESSYASKVKIKLLGSNNVSDFGGLIGYSYGEPITTCYVDQATIEGKKSVGGLIGRRSSSGAVNKCFVRNSEVKSFGDSKTGGLIGDLATSTLDSCYITGCSIVTDVDVPSVAGLVGSNTGDISNCYMYNSTLTGKADYGALIGANGSGARTPVISDCFVSQDHDILINTNYKDAPENCYYNVGDLAAFKAQTWSDGKTIEGGSTAWSNFNTTSFPPQLTELPEP